MDSDKSEIEDFCKDYLIELIDNNFVLDIKPNNNGTFKFSIMKNRIKNQHSPGQFFKWDDIKNDVIQFLNMIANSYSVIMPLKFSISLDMKIRSVDIALYDVINELNDDLYSNNDIREISFILKKFD